MDSKQARERTPDMTDPDDVPIPVQGFSQDEPGSQPAKGPSHVGDEA